MVGSFVDSYVWVVLLTMVNALYVSPALKPLECMAKCHSGDGDIPPGDYARIKNVHQQMSTVANGFASSDTKCI